MNDRKSTFDMKRAEPGYTPEAGEATAQVLLILNGFTVQIAFSILMNCAAILICNVSASFPAALRSARHHGAETLRCVRRNFEVFESNKRNAPDAKNPSQG